MANTGPGKHRHLDSRGKWTTDKDPDHVHSETPHPADGLTAAEVAGVRALLAAAGGGGGTTPEPPITPPATGPTISNVQIQNVTTTSAQVSWNVSPDANGQIFYGTTIAYGQQTTLEASYLPSHSQTITGLQPNTPYNIQVRSQASGTPLTADQNRQFTTAQTTPVPTPGRPWAAPVAPTIVNVAAGANLQTALNGAANGSTLVLASGATYSLSTGLAIASRSNIIIQGDGTQTIKSNGPGGSNSSSVLYITGTTSHITVSRVTLQGTNPDTGSGIYHPGTENQMGLANYGGDYIELDRVRIRNVYGDFAYLSGGGTHVWLHDGDWDYCGRMGVAFIDCVDVLIERNTLSHIGLICFDIEPNSGGEVIDSVTLQDNTIGSWSLSNYQTNWFLAYATANGSLSDLSVLRNVVTLGPVAGSNNPAGKGGLATNVQHSRSTNIIFQGNSTPVSGKSPLTGYPAVLYFAHVDTLNVTGNTQPLAAGSTLVVASDCTSATITPNP